MVVVVWLLLAIPAALVVHEAGHWLAARALGGRNIDVRLRGFGAEVAVDLDGRARTVAFLLAGPVVSVLFGSVVVVTIVTGPPVVVGIVSLLFGLGCLFGSDGARALRALASPSGNDGGESVR